MKSIVITSIFEPTEAVKKFASMGDYSLLIAGDRKSPAGWHCEGAEFLSVEGQQQLGFKLAEVLPYNHYCRKMLGYLVAINRGADAIIDTDDDNIPKEDWCFPALEDTFDMLAERQGFVNIYDLFTDQQIWPRGLPLRLINRKSDLAASIEAAPARVGIWQGLADEDPDVDAIYRLTSDQPCYFNERNPVVLGKGTITPFNTQNTLVRKELFPLMYLPTYVTFRFTDILRGLVAQPIMWLYDYHLGFTGATVVQKRNPHDYYKDFLSEIPMYQFTEKTVDLVVGAIRAADTIEHNLYRAYEALREEGIVTDQEMVTLVAWLTDLAAIKLSEKERTDSIKL